MCVINLFILPHSSGRQLVYRIFYRVLKPLSCYPCLAKGRERKAKRQRNIFMEVPAPPLYLPPRQSGLPPLSADYLTGLGFPYIGILLLEHRFGSPGPRVFPSAGFDGTLAHGFALRGQASHVTKKYVFFLLFATRYMRPEGRLAAAWRTAAAFRNRPYPVPDREVMARLPDLLLPEHPRTKEKEKEKRKGQRKDKGKTLAS